MYLLPIHKGTILFLIFILFLVVCPTKGQTLQKKELTPDLYSLWSNIQIDKISENSEWISWKTAYQNIDTLSLKNLVNGKIFKIPSVFTSTFAGNDFFIYQIGKALHILNLKTLIIETFPDIIKFEYSSSQNSLIILKKESYNNNILIIKSLYTRTFNNLQNISNYSLDPKGQNFIYSKFSKDSISSLILFNIYRKKEIKLIEAEKIYLFSNFTWSNEGESVAFFKSSLDKKIISLCFYNVKARRFSELKIEHIFNSQCPINFYWDPFYKISISNDNKRIFFSIKQNSQEKNNLQIPIEIWNGNDKWIYPQNQNIGNFESLPKISVWFPESNVNKQITTIAHPKIILTGDSQNAILYNPKDYEPQFEDEGPSNLYLMNLKTFKETLFLKKQSVRKNSIIPSPTGKFIAYFRDNNWWIYNIKLKSHTNITRKIPVKFTAKIHALTPQSLCGSPGWSENDNEILIYDQYDIWVIKSDGSKFRRLTKGRESKIVFRIDENSSTKNFNYLYDGIKKQNYDLKKALLLNGHGEDEKTGYFQWFPSNEIKKIIYEDSYIDNLNFNPTKKTFFLIEQKFNMPPKIQIIKGNIEKTSIYSSNKQHEEYLMGNSRLIHFQNSNKQILKAVLIYPANYEPSKKYPMIVNIYEFQSKNLNRYYNPTYFNESGFNPTLFSLNGYFVLMPDILLEEGNPGISAEDCVTAATQKIIDIGLANPKAIGIMGHSFGGYESAFIVTRSKLFAAAIASGAITDLNSFYFTVNQKSGKPDSWRFQNTQWNINKTPFEAPEIYSTNSPINHVDKVMTPILLWSGKEDKQVDVKQSLEFYLALRRLNKKAIMLLYPNENHTISDEFLQKDLTIRTLQWFDYFLKQERSEKHKWITCGIQ